MGVGARLLDQTRGEEASLLHRSPVLALQTPTLCLALESGPQWQGQPRQEGRHILGRKGALSFCSIIWDPCFLRSLTSNAPSWVMNSPPWFSEGGRGVEPQAENAWQGRRTVARPCAPQWGGGPVTLFIARFP